MLKLPPDSTDNDTASLLSQIHKKSQTRTKNFQLVHEVPSNTYRIPWCLLATILKHLPQNTTIINAAAPRWFEHIISFCAWYCFWFENMLLLPISNWYEIHRCVHRHNENNKYYRILNSYTIITCHSEA